MQLQTIRLKEYLAFMRTVYKGDVNFKDNKTGIIQIVCQKNRPFFRATLQEIVCVKSDGIILCAGVLIINKRASGEIYMSFFEALPDCKKAVSALVNYAVSFGRKHACNKLVVALDGHVNYSVGFGQDIESPTFGESYSPNYYHDYFADFTRVKFLSYYDSRQLVQERIERDLKLFEDNIEETTMEYADFGRGFAATMRRYTDLNNEIFAGHRYYSFRNYDEDVDLFRDMVPLLENNNLIFAKQDGKDIGFVLWYPDFNELVSVGKGASVRTYIMYKILKKRPKTAKVVEIGVLPEYRQKCAVLSLFATALQECSADTNKIISSWILDENTKSKAITRRYTSILNKEYFTYEKEI